MPGASMRKNIAGCGPPRSGRQMKLSIAPSLVAMSNVSSIIGASLSVFAGPARIPLPLRESEGSDSRSAAQRHHTAHLPIAEEAMGPPEHVEGPLPQGRGAIAMRRLY